MKKITLLFLLAGAMFVSCEKGNPYQLPVQALYPDDGFKEYRLDFFDEDGNFLENPRAAVHYVREEARYEENWIGKEWGEFHRDFGRPEIFVFRSEADFEAYAVDGETYFPTVDFSRNTLIVIQGTAGSGSMLRVNTRLILKDSGGYRLTIESIYPPIETADIMVWQSAILVPVLLGDAEIEQVWTSKHLDWNE